METQEQYERQLTLCNKIKINLEMLEDGDLLNDKRLFLLWKGVRDIEAEIEHKLFELKEVKAE